jgi:hypothetical protein
MTGSRNVSESFRKQNVIEERNRGWESHRRWAKTEGEKKKLEKFEEWIMAEGPWCRPGKGPFIAVFLDHA